MQIHECRNSKSQDRLRVLLKNSVSFLSTFFIKVIFVKILNMEYNEISDGFQRNFQTPSEQAVYDSLMNFTPLDEVVK